MPQQWYDLAEFQKDCVPYNDWMTESCSEAGYATAEQDQLWKDYLSCSWWNGYTGFINFIPGGVDVMVADKQHSIQGSMCASNYLTFMQGYSLCNSYEFNAVFGYIAAIIHGHSENVTGEQFAKWSEVHVKRVSETFDGERDCPEVLKTIKHRLNFQAGIKKPYPLKLKEGESYQIS